MRLIMLLGILLGSATMFAQQYDAGNTDVYKTSKGDLEVTLLGHGTLMLKFNDMVIHVDPWSKVADYAALPKADLILLTHEHGDHLDPSAIDKIKTDKTEFIMNRTCYDQLKTGIMLKNRDNTEFRGISVSAVPAYNIVNKKPDGEMYHPKGVGNGYILTMGGIKLYIAGDTENIPEMKEMAVFKNIDIAFLPMNLPYTMTPEMVADAAKALKPGCLYPYHYGPKEDLAKLTKLLDNKKKIGIMIKNGGNDIVTR